MANEFTINFNLSYASTSGSGLNDNMTPDALQVSQTNPGFAVLTQSVGTGTTTLDVINNVGTPGLLWLQNLDDENSVSYGSSLLELKLSAGRFAILEVASSGAVIQIAASTGTVRVFSKCYEL